MSTTTTTDRIPTTRARSGLDPQSLVGSYFTVYKDNDGGAKSAIDYYGLVVANPEPGWYLIELLAWGCEGLYPTGVANLPHKEDRPCPHVGSTRRRWSYYAEAVPMVEFRYDADKFRELVLYVADRYADDEKFGDTRLNKVLFFSDAFALQHLGDPITGARYQKLRHGPGPRALLPVRRELEEEGDVRVERVGSPPRTVTVPLRPPDVSLFSKDELAVVDSVIELFEGRTATLVSRLSHVNSPGWNLVEMGEDIPLESQSISTVAPPPEVLDRGRELAKRFGW